MTKDLNNRLKIINTPRREHDGKFHDIDLDNDFLCMTPKIWVIKTNKQVGHQTKKQKHSKGKQSTE